MAFGIYVHSPFCLQQCSYCDFTTKLYKNPEQQKQYTSLVVKEIELRATWFPKAPITSMYWGGGTPSLLEPEDILAVKAALVNQGFEFSPGCETTIEINPGTIDQKKLDELLQIGVNRFSVGVQTFDPNLLRLIGREHTPVDSENTIELLQNNRVNFSVDFLFGLPQQSFADFLQDYFRFMDYSPHHISAYLLTLPKLHKLNANRAPEDELAEMLEFISEQLQHQDYEHYEISNYAKPGFHSKHNMNAWLGEEYWGLGISAHSFFRHETYGVRFWNPNTIEAYDNQLLSKKEAWPYNHLPESQVEILNYNESLSDYCHTRLRISRGLNWDEIRQQWGEDGYNEVKKRFQEIKFGGLLEETEGGFRLSSSGKILSNQVIRHFFFC